MLRIASLCFSGRGILGRAATLTALAVCVVAICPGSAAADLKSDSSLKFAPADASFYVSGMRMREVFDKVAASNAVAKVKSLPSVQFGWAMAMAQWENPQEPQIQMIKGLLADPANQQLLELLKDAASHEFFIYGDHTVGNAFSLLNDISAASSAGQMEALSAGDFQNIQTYQARNVLEVLEKQGDLKIPTIVEGMKLSDARPALDQLIRLEAVAKDVLQQQPQLLERLSREQIGGGEFLTLKLDGSLIPWPPNMQNPQGVDPELVKKLMAKITALKLVISIGVMDDYLLISISADNGHLGQLGQGELLYDVKEMGPVRDAADKPITEIAYVSESFVKQLSAVDRQMDQVTTMVKAFAPMMLATAPQLQEELIADVERFAEYVKQNMPQPASYSAFNYLTPEGYESFSYSWTTESALDATQNLSILNHVGGNPIAFYASRGKSDPEQLDDLAVFLSRAAYFGEQIALQQIDATQQANYERLKTDFLPLLQRLGQVTREKLAPAFADSQSALVLDAQSTSETWHALMPPTEGELPMLELGIVMGVSDANLVKEGFSEYFDIAQEVIDKLHEASTGDLRDMFPDPVPPIKLAKPATRDVSGGTVYYYALPAETGLDKQLAPNAGLTESVMAASLLPRFTARLLASTPLEGSGPLANTDRPLGSAFQFNFAAFLDALSPWIDYAMAMGMAVSYESQPPMNPMENIPQQVHDVIDVLKCFRGVSGVTYKDGDAMVTHAQWRFEDLQ